MSTRSNKTVTISLPPELAAELDRVREREHRTRSEILREALRRYIAVAERDRKFPLRTPYRRKSRRCAAPMKSTRAASACVSKTSSMNWDLELASGTNLTPD